MAETIEAETEDWRDELNTQRALAAPGQPLHEHLSNSIAALLDKGVWRSGDRIPGHRELAIACGVSPVTMYKALSAVVRDGRLQRRQGLGTFVVGGGARPAGPASTCLAIVFPLFDGDKNGQQGSWGESLLRGVLQALKPHESSVNVRLLTEFKAERLIEIARDEISGFLFVSPTADQWADVERIASQEFPVVVLQSAWSGITVPFVDADNAAGVRLAVDHLLALGHPRIACGVASVNHSDHRERAQGFRDAMDASGHAVRADYVLERWMPLIETVDDDYRTLLTKPERPTALITFDTPSALRAVNVARELGLRIGKDLSLATFDDDEVSRGLQPPLTTVCQPIEMMAATAILLLLDAVLDRPIEPLAHYAPMTLIARGSTAPPRKGAGGTAREAESRGRKRLLVKRMR